MTTPNGRPKAWLRPLEPIGTEMPLSRYTCFCIAAGSLSGASGERDK
jgi:hypothetical protein